MERAGGFCATTYITGVTAAAVASIAGFSAARLGRSREVSSAPESRCVCARVATCVAIMRLYAADTAAAPPRSRALVAHD